MLGLLVAGMYFARRRRTLQPWKQGIRHSPRWLGRICRAARIVRLLDRSSATDVLTVCYFSFFKIISKATTGDTVINFSDRFSLSHMTGVFPRKLADDLEAIPPPYHPRAKRQLANANPAAPAAGAGAPAPAVPGAPAAPAAAAPAPGAAAPAPAPAAPAAAGAAAFTMPYTLQTGLTKYAPMQPMPPTKITANNPTPLWPTSASKVATTWLPAASVVTTITQSPSYSATSLVNTVRLISPKSASIIRLCQS